VAKIPWVSKLLVAALLDSQQAVFFLRACTRFLFGLKAFFFTKEKGFPLVE